MKKIILEIIIIILVLSLTSCSRKKVDVTGLYQWFEENSDTNLKYIKSIYITKNDDGDLEVTLKDSNRNPSGDVINVSLDDTITIGSKIELGKVITEYSETEFAYYKHELIFEKNYVEWRYCIEEFYLSDDNNMSSDIESKEYFKLEKYIP